MGKRSIAGRAGIGAFAALWVAMAFATKEEVVFFHANLEKAGSLSEVVGERANEIDSLIVEGDMNEADFNTLWDMGYNGHLAVLDLSDARPEGDSIPGNAFFHENEQSIKTYFRGTFIEPLPYLRKVVLPSSLKIIGDSAFAYTRIRSIEFPERMECIGSLSFYRCPALSGRIVIPEGIREIKTLCFAECPKIEEVSFPSSLREIYPGGFDKCHSLRNVEFKEGLGYISYFGFRETRIETLVLPRSLNVIHDEAFGNVTTLKVIYSLNPEGIYALSFLLNGGAGATTRETLYSFTGTPTDIPVYIPVGSLHDHLRMGWNRFTNITETTDLPELPGGSSVESIDQDTAEVEISLRDGRLVVKSDSSGIPLEVYSIDGTTVATRKISAGETSLALPSGIYLVRAGRQSAKVFI